MSKLSFRSRQVDYTKPLPIYLNHDLPDLQDFAAINRSVPLMPTGMEKDEEAEHHLQRALSALQAFGATISNEYAIPTPKVEIDNKMYERIYNVECPKQKTYIRIQPFSNDYDYPDYDADYEDENWLNEKKKTLPKEFNQDLLLYFETIMDRLEKATSHSNILISREEAKLLLMKELNNDETIDMINTLSISNSILKQQQKYKIELEEFILSIYEYWKTKRLNCNHPLTPIVLTDKSGVLTQPNNPYLVFRRRTEKMQTRKNRKNEEQSYEKMLILKRDLCRAQHILKLIKKRENFKKEFLKLTLETFEKRYKLNDFDGTLTDSIACSLKPLLNSNNNNQTIMSINSTINSTQQQPNTLNNLLNNSFTNNKLNNNTHYNPQTNDLNKNLSSIDKTIVNLINSNKLKTLGSPPHSSLKKIPQLEKEFLRDSIYKNTNLNNINSKLCKQLTEKQQKRLRKEKFQQQPSTVNQNTISNLINNSNNKKIYGDLIDLNKLESNQNKITVNLNNSNSNTAPLTNRSNNNNNIIIFNNLKRRNNRRPINNSNRNSSSDSNNNRYSLNENENLDSNNNKNNRNLNLNHQLFKKVELNPELLSNSRLNHNNLNSEDENSINNLNIIFNEFKEYEEELRQNQIENLDSILHEAKNRLSTTSDKDGYWCFKRKEGCKYLPQNGPIFKNDVLEADELLKPPPQLVHPLSNSAADTIHGSTNTEEIVNNHFYQLQQQANKKQKRLELKKKDRLKELQQFYYGYAITKHNRHLGLVRRRLGRGGRILLDKFNENLIDFKNSKSVNYINRNQSIKKINEKIYPLNLSKFKTYYPIECFNLNNGENETEHSNNDSNLEKDKNIRPNNEATLKPNKTTNDDLQTKTTTVLPSVSKLKLKSFYDTELEFKNSDLMNTIDSDLTNKNTKDKFLESYEDELTFDHRLFSLYQFEHDKLNELLDNELNIRKYSDVEDSVHPASDQQKVSSPSLVNLINDEDYNYKNKIEIDDDNDFELFEYDDFNHFKTNLKSSENYDNHSNTNCDAKTKINNKIYDRTNLIRFNFSSISQLNDEYHSSTDECNLNISNVKLAIKTLKIPNKIQSISTDEFVTVETKSDQDLTSIEEKCNQNDKSNEKFEENKKLIKLGESIANITSTTLTPPSPSPPMIVSEARDQSPINLFASKEHNNNLANNINTSNINKTTISDNKINNSMDISCAADIITNEIINSNTSNNISQSNNKILVSLPNNSSTTSPVLNNQNQTGRYIQSFNKIKNFNYANDKIMQPLVNGTNGNIFPSSSPSTSSLSSSSSSLPSSSLSSQTYLVKKQTKQHLINNNVNTKGSGLFYSSSSSSLPSSSSTSSSSTHSIPTIVITPSSKLATTSSSSLVSLSSAIQQTNQNLNNSNTNTNTIVVNGVLTKKKDENNPFLLNNNTNFQNFHHMQQHQENQISSTTPATNQFNTSINTNSNNITNGLIPTQKLLQAIQFGSTLQNSTSIQAGIINNNSNNLMNVMSNSTHHNNLFKTTSNSISSISSATNTNNNNNDLNNSTKLM